MCMRRHFVVSLTSFQSARHRARCQESDYLPYPVAARLSTHHTHRAPPTCMAGSPSTAVVTAAASTSVPMTASYKGPRGPVIRCE